MTNWVNQLKDELRERALYSAAAKGIPHYSSLGDSPTILFQSQYPRDLLLCVEACLPTTNYLVGRLPSFNQILIPCYKGEGVSIVRLAKRLEISRRSIWRAFFHGVHKLGRR
jgi:hypothetical protein